MDHGEPDRATEAQAVVQPLPAGLPVSDPPRCVGYDAQDEAQLNARPSAGCTSIITPFR